MAKDKNENLIDCFDPYVALGSAIVMQACKDYRKTYRLYIRTYRMGEKSDDKLEELEKFFRSAWYRTLTDIDGEHLMKRIREEVLAREKKMKRKKRGKFR